MAKTLSPASEEDLAQAIADAKAPFRLQGAGSKAALGNPVAAEQVLSLAKFSGIEIYEPEELILEAGSGTALETIEQQLSARNQMLAFEPPDYSELLGTEKRGTLGGAIACGLAGPRRIKAGSARDHVLGFRCVTGTGEIVKAGARVVKNVTGYDLPKLLTGSFGTLAAMTAITLKVLPRPEMEETLFFKGLDDETAIRLMSEAMQSSAETSSAAHIPGEGTYLRLEGIAPSVAFRRDRLAALLSAKAELLPEKHSRRRWRAIANVEPFHALASHAVWRLSIPPREGAATVARIRGKLEAAHFYDWAGGLVWLAVANGEDGGAAAIRAALPSGHATLIRAPAAVRAAVNAFQPQSAALAALSLRVKQSFDPLGLLNPGKMYREF